jgi:poly(A) polymerase
MEAEQQVAPNSDRALAALLRARLRAEGRDDAGDVVLASPEDLRALDRVTIRQQLDPLMLAERPDLGLEALLEGGVLSTLLPEVQALVGFGDGEWRHKDVWRHTKQVVMQSVPRLEVRWAALFHDIGKVRTRSISETGEVHFFGHAEVGARMFEKLDRREKLFKPEPALANSVRFLVLHHLRASQYDASWTDSAVRRFTRELGIGLEDLLCLSRADITTKRPEKKRRGIQMIDELAERIANLAAEDAIVPALPTGVGNAIMESFKLPPSRLIGELKRALEACVEAGEVEAHHESEYYVQFLAERRERFGLP